MPDVFLRIDLGRVGREVLMSQAPFVVQGEELANLCAAMNLRAVPQQQDAAGDVLEQVPKEPLHPSRSQRLSTTVPVAVELL